MNKVNTVNIPLLIFVKGNGSQGKTSLSHALSIVYDNENINIVYGDIIAHLAIQTGNYPNLIMEQHNNIPHIGFFIQREDVDIELITNLFIKHIEKVFLDTTKVVIIDGCALNCCIDTLVEQYNDIGNVFVITMVKGVAFLDGKEFPSDVVYVDKSERKLEVEKYLKVAKNIQHHIKCEIRDKILKNSYQYFDDLGQIKVNSNSPIKVECLKLPDIKGKRILDVGCNRGYISFKMRKDGASVVGIDINLDDLKKASGIKNSIYDVDDVTFYHTDIFDFNDHCSFDIIVAASVFHYFREDQPRFFEKAYALLKDGGLLILEVGIPSGDESEIIQYKRHPDEVPCYFPKFKALCDMAKNFKLSYDGDSVNQKGDNIPRKVLHFIKV